MGSLDEAIREHLALKRRQGLSDDELKRLEDEAFGPPARPGEPDFPEPEAEGDEEVEQAAPEEHETTVLPPEPGLEEVSGQPSLEGAEIEPMDVGEEPIAMPEPAVEEAEEIEEAPPLGPPTEEAEAPAAEGPEEPDEGPGAALLETDEELDVGELDLDLDEVGEPDEAAELGEEPGGETEAAGEPEPAIESLETVEHPMPEKLEELESGELALDEPEPAEPEPAEPEPAEPEPAEPEPAEPESEEHELGEQEPEEPEPPETAAEEPGEDVLEETPEFLRDAPEDDELWFEQGEPKDFDF